ncbi:hypothetical protein AB0A71_24995 [Kitasatospora aureofaciens]|uniref:hypothetical protein n=1 Tax=Kitasatospora aureofaciens TaxID=1894 RepID=UPI0033D687D9
MGIFLRALGGVRLMYQLRRCSGPDDETTWDEREVQAAAARLRTDPVDGLEEDEEDGEAEDWGAHSAAKSFRETVLSTWRGAARRDLLDHLQSDTDEEEPDRTHTSGSEAADQQPGMKA